MHQKPRGFPNRFVDAHIDLHSFNSIRIAYLHGDRLEFSPIFFNRDGFSENAWPIVENGYLYGDDI